MKNDNRGAVALNAELGILPIGPHDHPEPQTMAWSDLELSAIRAYAARCVAAERERYAEEIAQLRAEGRRYREQAYRSINEVDFGA